MNEPFRTTVTFEKAKRDQALRLALKHSDMTKLTEIVRQALDLWLYVHEQAYLKSVIDYSWSEDKIEYSDCCEMALVLDKIFKLAGVVGEPEDE